MSSGVFMMSVPGSLLGLHTDVCSLCMCFLAVSEGVQFSVS